MLIALIVVSYLLIDSWLALAFLYYAGSDELLDRDIITPTVLIILLAPFILLVFYVVRVFKVLKAMLSKKR